MPAPVSPSDPPAPAVAQSLKERLSPFLPGPLIELLDRLVFRVRRGRIQAVHAFFARFGLNVVKKADYYSTLPVLSEIEKNRARWDRPSELPGIDIDLDALRDGLLMLADRWEPEFEKVAGDHRVNTAKGFGPGYPHFDARTLYYMLREHRPSTYLEVGSGLSTYYASLAARENAAEGKPMHVTCIEPYPYDALHMIEGIELVQSLVQDVPLARFEELGAGDILFIDSSHALKVDSDVAYLLLEVLPRLRPGVIVHIHDVHFPFNIPFPADTWLFGERWPVYWNEAMAVQTFLAFNTAFEVIQSVPMIRHHDEPFLARRFPDYEPLAKDINPPSSLWLRRVHTDRAIATA